MDGGADDYADEGDNNGDPEEESVAVGEVEEPDVDGGTDGGCDVVAKSVVADSFSTTGGVEYIDGHSGSCHGGSSEGDAVEGSEDGKHGDGCCHKVPSREGYEEEIDDE